MQMESELLTRHLVHSSELSNVHYIPEFVTEQEEQYLIQQVNAAPKPKWKTLPNRSLGKVASQWSLASEPHSDTLSGGEITRSGKLLQQPLPPFLNRFPDIIGRLRDLGVFRNSKIGEPNHVIVNEYLPGQGIMPHEDGPRYHPVVCTISLGSHTVMNYFRYEPQDSDSDRPVRDRDSEGEQVAAQSGTTGASSRPIDSKPVLSLLLEPRSLVITSSELYTQHLHGISPNTLDSFECEDSADDVDGTVPKLGKHIQVANLALLKGAREKEVILKGGVLERGTRISLTCRSVEEVLRTSKLVK